MKYQYFVVIIFLNYVFSSLLLGSELINTSSNDIFHRELIERSFQAINPATVSLKHKCLKSTDFSNLDIRDINIEESDFYNANLSYTLLTSEQEKIIRASFPLFEYKGRITEIRDNDVLISMKGLTLTNLEEVLEKARKKDPIALFKAAYIFETYGTFDEEVRAFLYYSNAFDLGLREAGNNLAWMYENGRGRAKSSSFDPHSVYQEYYVPHSDAHPTIRFNVLRCRAMYQNDKEAQFELAQLMSQQPNYFSPQLINLWLERAWKNGHGEAAYQLAVRHKQGQTSLISMKDMLLWYGRAVELDHAKACRELADLLLWENDIWPDIKGAFDLYLSAAQLEDESAQKRLALFYSVCFGNKSSPKKALFWYKRAAYHGSVSAIFNVARLTERYEEASGKYAKAREGYEAVLSLVPDHAGALLNLARFYLYGWETPLDASRAENMILAAAENNHMAAILKLSSLQDFLPPPMMEYHAVDEIHTRVQQLKHSKRVAKEAAVAAANTSSHSQLLESVKVLLARFQEMQDRSSLQVNYEIIPFDPYSSDYISTYDDISEEMVQSAQLESVAQALYAAYDDPFYRNHAFYDQRHLVFIRKYLSGFIDQGNNHLKKMFVWWYTQATSSSYTGKDTFLSHYKEDERKLMGQGRMLLRLMSHIASFIDEKNWYEKEISAQLFSDILDRFLENENWRILYQQKQDGEMPLALKISKIIHDYKHRFIKLHQSLTGGKKEVYNALRLALGVTHDNHLSSLEITEEALSSVTTSVTSFMQGGITHSSQQKKGMIPALTPQLLISLLQKSLYDPQNSNLTTSDIEDFVAHDEFLFSEYRTASLEEHPNSLYFDPFAEDLRPAAVGSEVRLACYKPKLFEYILKTYGYLTELSL
ncbi:MAG: hypothetical protein K2Y08_07975 [Alphaproteobacteria bacterium]|nr:hypothetical protein [Silvanigrellaceae bacterium]MBX9787258.1 hypothetical protein [Alphaproteobacteria bacterium]